jgi:hypothetical protein
MRDVVVALHGGLTKWDIVFKELSRFTMTGADTVTELPKSVYKRTSISGTTFSGRKCLSGTIFHAI